MRRNDRAITDPAAIDAIIRGCDCCRLGLADGNEVYIVPMSFGFTHESGRKIDLLHAGGAVSFELDCGHALVEGPTACKYSARYSCVMGTGRVRFLTEPEAQRQALRELMRQNTGSAAWDFPPEALCRLCLFALDVETISAKQH